MKLAALDRALGQQPRHNMHDAGRDLERFAGEADPHERVERQPVVAAGIVEIGTCLVSEDHRLGVETTDQAGGDPRFGVN